MAYRHILAGVDVTEEAAQVLAAARDVAARNGARLSVCTVVKPLTQVYGGIDVLAYAQATANFEQQAADQAREHVARSAGRERDDDANRTRRIVARIFGLRAGGSRGGKRAQRERRGTA